ncbi:hypothetical protein J6590_069647 [Homalodisca vitripennis]|nr:hypothetical protein J6590_069647 [Homalodisca vitripennis]
MCYDHKPLPTTHGLILGYTSSYWLYLKILSIPQDPGYTSRPRLYLKMIYLKILAVLKILAIPQDDGCTSRYSLYLKTPAIPQDDIPQDTG